MPGFEPSHMYRSCAENHSSLVFVGDNRQLYWAIISKLDDTYAEKDIPRRHNSQSDAQVRKFANFEVGCNTKLSEIWENAISSTYAVLEEGLMDNWSYGRFVCVGDSIHKGSINVSQGISYKFFLLIPQSDRTGREPSHRKRSRPRKQHCEDA
jgi:hypothetical protein